MADISLRVILRVRTILQAPVVQKVDSAIHRINLYPLEARACLVLIIIIIIMIIIIIIIIIINIIIQNFIHRFKKKTIYRFKNMKYYNNYNNNLFI